RAPPREGSQGPAERPGRYWLAYATRRSEEGAFVSPRWSSSRGAVLLSVAECSELVGRSKRTIWNWLRDDSVYREDHYVRTAAGNAVKVTYVDPAPLPVAVPAHALPMPEAVDPGDAEAGEIVAAAESLEDAAHAIARAGNAGRHQLVTLAAARWGVSKRTVYRRVKAAERGELEVRRRSDAGKPRIPA